MYIQIIKRASNGILLLSGSWWKINCCCCWCSPLFSSSFLDFSNKIFWHSSQQLFPSSPPLSSFSFNKLFIPPVHFSHLLSQFSSGTSSSIIWGGLLTEFPFKQLQPDKLFGCKINAATGIGNKRVFEGENDFWFKFVGLIPL